MGKVNFCTVLFFCSLAGCDSIAGLSESPVECSSDQAKELLYEIVKDQIAGVSRKEELTDEDGLLVVSKSKIKAALELLVFGLEDVRTTNVDPNSTKKSCEARFSVGLSDDFIEKVND